LRRTVDQCLYVPREQKVGRQGCVSQSLQVCLVVLYPPFQVKLRTRGERGKLDERVALKNRQTREWGSLPFTLAHTILPHFRGKERRCLHARCKARLRVDSDKVMRPRTAEWVHTSGSPRPSGFRRRCGRSRHGLGPVGSESRGPCLSHFGTNITKQ
jgi:hypothetical protein